MDEETQGVEMLADNSEFSWQASEYVFQKKRPLWYLAVLGGATGMIGYAVLTQQWLSAAVFVMIAITLLLYANKQPRVLEYHLDTGGLTVGLKHYSYNDFKSFTVIQEVGWHSIELEPNKRFMPRLNILFDDDDFETITNILGSYLPHEERPPDVVDRISRRFKI